MRNLGLLPVFITILFHSNLILAQEQGVKKLDFLIGTWETREENTETGWWETATRTINYTLEHNYIEVKSKSINSNGKEREYIWYINYNEKTKQFQMVSMFSNWYKTQLDILEWDSGKRTLTIRNKPGAENEFHERFGEITFSENFDEYTWYGENKYGDPNNPSVWKYIEKGFRKE